MKKNILIYTYNLEVGGIERSLIGLLKSIDYNIYNVDLYMFKHEGVFMKDIPSEVNLLDEDKITQFAGIPILDVMKKGNLTIGIVRLYAKLKALYKQHVLRQNVTGEFISQITYPFFCKRMNNLKKEYDIALSFYWPHYYVMNNVVANVKVGWIHTDYDKINLNNEKELEMWSKLDYVAAVSESCRETFIKKYPDLKHKAIVIENILPIEFINNQANLINVDNEIIKEDGVINICSVGRFTEAKNFDNIPNICKMILDSGVNIRWYLIGYGADEELIRKKIREERIENRVIILGKKENPYPYIKQCDIYIQPSRFEGKAVTVREAQMLNKSVIITNFSTSQSQLKNGVDGIIVPLENKECAQGIISFINNKELQLEIIKNTQNYDYTNKDEINKIYKLISF